MDKGELSNSAALRRERTSLEQSEGRLRNIIQTAMDGFWTVDLDGRLLEVNQAYCRMSGYEASELLGMRVPDLDLNDTPEKLQVHINNVKKQGYDRFDSQHRRKDGSIMEVEVSAQYHDFDNGQIAAFIRDTTDRKRSETCRAMGQEMLSILNQTDSESEAIHRIIELLKNTARVDAVGIRLQQEDDYPYFLQQGFSRDFLAKESSLVMRNREGGICRDESGKASLECTCGLVISGRTDPASPFCTKGGSVWSNDSGLLLELRASEDPRSNPRNECIHQGYSSVALVPIRAKGSIVGLLQLNARRKGCFSLDIIETLERVAENIGEAMLRKRSEEEKRKLEAHFQHAQKMESVGRLAGGVAHDFNNLLTVILGHAQIMLMEMPPEDPMYHGLQEIARAAERSGALTRQLLAFARKQTIAPSSQSINIIVENLLKMLHRLIGEDIQLVWQPADKLWQVRVDPSQIDQILANLCVNARDAIANVGKITIETGNITFDREFCLLNPGFVPGEYVLLVVSDNGCGMDRETLSHVFEPFFTTKEVGKGTGLGLATIYGIVRQNNGFIKVYSEPGFGTTFKIFLPRYDSGGKPPQVKVAAQSLRRGQETILLVEDETAILRLVSELLKRQGYSVLAADTPGEALKLAAEHAGHIDLLITDTVMPEMNGKELADKVTSFVPQ